MSSRTLLVVAIALGTCVSCSEAFQPGTRKVLSSRTTRKIRVAQMSAGCACGACALCAVTQPVSSALSSVDKFSFFLSDSGNMMKLLSYELCSHILTTFTLGGVNTNLSLYFTLALYVLTLPGLYSLVILYPGFNHIYNSYLSYLSLPNYRLQDL